MSVPLVFRGFPFGHPRRRPRRQGRDPFAFAARIFAGVLRLPSIDIALLIRVASFITVKPNRWEKIYQNKSRHIEQLGYREERLNNKPFRRQEAKVGQVMNMKTKLQILKVWIEHTLDESPDTSHMGEYAAKPANEYAIDRTPHAQRQFQWFNPSFNYVDDNGQPKDGLTPAQVRKYVQEDYRRMENLNAGQWHYIGIIAKAQVQFTCGCCQVLRSGGLWGVESDSGAEYLNEIATEELASLRTELEAAGFGKRAIDHAFSNGTTEGNILAKIHGIQPEN